jgi:predicted nuclease of restriction endonuclease-like (RecB) superfamily
VRDPVMLEFLGLPGTGKLLEADVEKQLRTDADQSLKLHELLCINLA